MRELKIMPRHTSWVLLGVDELPIPFTGKFVNIKFHNKFYHDDIM